MVNLNVNGTARSFDGDDDMPLLWYLRDELRLTGTRFGCGAGLCGACTVHVDGQAVRACQTQMRTVQNKRVTTIEGLSADGSHPLQRAWAAANVPQCGYCQTGQIMQAAALLSRTPNPTDQDIDRTMAGNICRCGTYQRIRAAIKQAAGARGRPGMSLIENVSRRQFLEGLFSTGAFVIAAQVLPERRLGAGPGRAHPRPVGAALAQRLSGHRARRHGVHRHAPVRDGHGHPHVAAARRRRRARGRLEPRPHRAGARRSEIRRPEHRRLALDSRLLRSVPPRRRVGARDARQRRRGAVGRAGHRVRGPEPRGRAPAERTQASRSARWCPPPPSCRCPRPRRCASSRRTSGSSSARSGRSTTSPTSPPARRRSGSTSIATTWWWPRSSIRRSSAAR